MFEDMRDISGEDLDAFGHLQFQKIGHTGDGNNYPIFTGYIGSEKGVWIGVPVDDYLATIEHLNNIDKQLTKLEERAHIIVPDGQEEYMNSLSGNNPKTWGDYGYKTKPSLSLSNYIRCGQPKRFDWIKEKQ